MIDLRSDTLTLPSKEMLESILTAKLGDEGRVNSQGRGEDESTNDLEDLAASLTGKDSALFFPTGTSANTCAVISVCKRGDLVLTDKRQHMFLAEKICFIDEGFGMKQMGYEKDFSDIDELTNDYPVKLVCLENTHNYSGGKVIQLQDMAKIYEICHSKNIHVHLDGARLFNAATSLELPASEICKYVDSVMFCISKGLGAPIGSLLCGSKDFINIARDKRKLIGATMRQSGVAASCGIYALTHNLGDLRKDHENALLCASHFNEHSYKDFFAVDPKPESNIVLINIEKTGLKVPEILALLEENGLLASKVSDTEIRLVFHRENSKKDAIDAANILIAINKIYGI